VADSRAKAAPATERLNAPLGRTHVARLRADTLHLIPTSGVVFAPDDECMIPAIAIAYRG
jgi:hypothetical protein